MKYVFIINPVSGKTNYKLIKSRIEELKLENYIIYKTTRKYEATEISKKYKDQKDAIVYAVGGDGTLNEVVNGIVGGKCKLGIIPTGSGNDFYKTIKNHSKKEIRVDCGKVNDKYFINIASVGFDAFAAYLANKYKNKVKIKKLAYIFALIKSFFVYKAREYSIKVNNIEETKKQLLIAVCNGRYYGGGFKIAPLASFDDDHFDIYFANEVGKLKFIKILIALFNSKHEQNKNVKKIISTKIEIESKNNMIVNIDGEIIKDKKITIEMIPNSIVIYNNQNIVNKLLKK